MPIQKVEEKHNSICGGYVLPPTTCSDDALQRPRFYRLLVELKQQLAQPTATRRLGFSTVAVHHHRFSVCVTGAVVNCHITHITHNTHTHTRYTRHTRARSHRCDIQTHRWWGQTGTKGAARTPFTISLHVSIATKWSRAHNNDLLQTISSKSQYISNIFIVVAPETFLLSKHQIQQMRI